MTSATLTAQSQGQPQPAKDHIGPVEKLRLLTGFSGDRFERILRIAERLFSVSHVDISLFDGEERVVLASVGDEVSQLTSSDELLALLRTQTNLFHVPDMRLDRRLETAEFVLSGPHLKFLASCPIFDKQGERLGAITVASQESKPMSAHNQSVLKDLADMVENELNYIALASSDPLTKLPINGAFSALLNQSLKQCERDNKSAVLVTFEIKRFREEPVISYDERNRYVMLFAEQLKHYFRQSDVVGRIGKQEFAALLLDTSLTKVQGIIKKLQSSVDIYNSETGYEQDVSFLYSTSEFQARYPVTADILLSQSMNQLGRQLH